MRDLYYFGGDVPVSECVRAVVHFRDNAIMTALEVPEDAWFASEEVDGEWLIAEPIPDYPPSWPVPDRVKRHYLPPGGVILDVSLPQGSRMTPGMFVQKYMRHVDAMTYVGKNRFLLQRSSLGGTLRYSLQNDGCTVDVFQVTHVEELALV